MGNEDALHVQHEKNIYMGDSTQCGINPVKKKSHKYTTNTQNEINKYCALLIICDRESLQKKKS